MKIFTVVGARPQFIKAAVVSRAFKEHRLDVHEVLVHTGQHYDANMSDIFFDELDIPRPDYNLGIGGGTHGQNTGRMIEKIEEILFKEKPDWLLVYGDTDSTLAGALAAVKLHIPVAHVEAGLRSFNRRMPEEINRVLTDHMSTLLFAPTEVARTNLRNEGIAEDKIHVLGDVMYDAALYYKERAKKPDWFDVMGLAIGEFALCTVHRAENTDDTQRMADIFEGLAGINLQVVLPLHPRAKAKILENDIILPSNVHCVAPVSYLEMIWLEISCKFIATDSGGVQKEAFFHKKPCITLRDETEWVELVHGGFNVVTGTAPQKIVAATKAITQLDFDKNLYGDGRSGKRLCELIK